MFPSPTAEPAVARTKPNFPEKELLFSVIKTTLFFVFFIIQHIFLFAIPKEK